MLSRPDATYSEDLYRFVWPDGTEMLLERFTESRDDIACELTVRSAHPTKGGTLVDGKRLLLLGANSQRDMRKALEERDIEPDWGGMLEQATTLARRRYREGEPAVDLVSTEFDGIGRYLVRPFVFDDGINLIYGSGDSGKSLFTLALALAVASGHEVAGVVSERTGPVLYLDWEDSPATHQERLRGLAAGAGIELTAGMVVYRRMTASLKESQREVRKDVANLRAALVIIDSLGMACGGDPSDANGIIQTMTAARGLGVPTLGIHHIAKDAKDKSTPYGSVYASTTARGSWYVQAEREAGQLAQVLTNYKSNRGQRAERQSFRFVFSEDAAERIERIEIVPLTFAQSKTVGEGALRWKIAEYLRTGAKEIPAIAEALEAKAETVKRTLNRYKGTMFVQTGDNTWGITTDRDTVLGQSETVPEVGRDTPPLYRGVSPTIPVQDSEEDRINSLVWYDSHHDEEKR